MLKLFMPLASLPLLLLPMLPSSFSWHLTSITLLFLSFLSALLLIPSLPTPLSLAPFLSLDLMSTCLIILTIWISSLMITASYKILQMGSAPKVFILMVSILAIILILTFSMNNFLLFYIFFEASLIPTLFLILAWGYQPERLQASMYLMIYTVTASLPLLMSLIIMFTSFYSLSMLLPMWTSPFSTSSMSSIWWMISITAFLVKMPLYFFHLWLPKAHVEAPIAGSMILAGILLKLGSYGILRFMMMNFKMAALITPLLMSLSMWGAIITSMICLRQTDLKALIAYSSVGHMSIMAAGMITSFLWGWHGALILMLSHGLCSSALFMLANMTYENTNTRSMFLTKGLLTLFPSMALWWLLFSAANMAAPPSMNLLGEIFLLTSILGKSLPLASLIAILSFLAAAYSLHLYTSSQYGPISIFSNPLNTYPVSSYTPLLFHFLPLIILMMKANLISQWI